MVLGTLAIQGLTLRPLLLLLRLPGDGTVETEIRLARKAALKAAIAELQSDNTPAAERIRLEYGEALDHAWHGQDPHDLPDNALRRQALSKSRRAIHDLRSAGTIGDDAYRRVEEELDWLELSAHRRRRPTRRELSAGVHPAGFPFPVGRGIGGASPGLPEDLRDGTARGTYL